MFFEASFTTTLFVASGPYLDDTYANATWLLRHFNPFGSVRFGLGSGLGVFPWFE
ncbi:hypothetical protein MtrunA17_Chr8g0384291 [Medicago truncatula]|uniref:Uncharacterized protein n=1 Tax=Medicago truncatula TaxID=3880 RepID=G7LE27_MEDTR|nr:hypothetical protein MTR_8g093720 [Medicago truncatula]RHN43115.1 hypothetical protein MtrunA17_Chr8g0384291 [Medicago truncatula]